MANIIVLKIKCMTFTKERFSNDDDNIFVFDRIKKTILRQIFIFSIVEMSKNSPKQNILKMYTITSKI